MNKAQLIDLVADEAGMSIAVARKAVAAVLEGIATGLERDGEVSLPSFGSFRLTPIEERDYRNPRNGATVTIAAHKKVRFKPSSVMESALNQ